MLYGYRVNISNKRQNNGYDSIDYKLHDEKWNVYLDTGFTIPYIYPLVLKYYKFYNIADSESNWKNVKNKKILKLAHVGLSKQHKKFLSRIPQKNEK